MAQVYPEDRGTNYAIREGRAAGRRITDSLMRSTPSLPAEAQALSSTP
jgi:hypothetical protein